jgi:hypothetical protein
MPNLFAASGHRNYARSARLYLQTMFGLPKTPQWLHERLSSEQHVVRRSDSHCAAVSLDLAIELVMM